MSEPRFEPHPVLRNGHAQTLAGVLLPWRVAPRRSAHVADRRSVQLDDGDRIVLHDDLPAAWSAGDAAALLVHGLSGSHESGYMVRISRRLSSRGLRVFRMDARGWGAGVGLARQTAHAGRSEDVRAALRWVAEECPASPLCAAGFSLGGNLILKMLGEDPDAVPDALTRAAAVNPSVDLAAACEALQQGWNRMYDRHFVRELLRHAEEVRRLLPDAPVPPPPATRPRCLRELDDVLTAPWAGFRSADDYYARASSGPLVGAIGLPTLLLTARDDPMIPARSIEALELPPSVTLEIAERGGHLGYISRCRDGPRGDRRWMDRRVADWLTEPRGAD